MIACSTSVRCGSSLETALADIANAGFKKVDILTIDGWVHVNSSDLADNWDETVGKVDGLLAQHGLTPIALNTGVGPQLHDRSPEANGKRVRETAALVRLMDHYDITTAAIQPRNADRERPWEDVLRDCLATLGEQKAAVEAAGRRFALELHVNSPFESLEQAQRFIAEMPDMPVVYDPTHFVMQGLPVKETGWLMRNAGHVHLRDAAEGKLQAPFGEGSVDFDWLLGTLRDSGYTGNISLEYLETNDFDVLDSSRRLYDVVARYFPE
jgi:sugar phosphate isomerase/epimerase